MPKTELRRPNPCRCQRTTGPANVSVPPSESSQPTSAAARSTRGSRRRVFRFSDLALPIRPLLRALCLAAALIAPALATAAAQFRVPAKNPVLPGADPHVLVLDGTAWLYPTWGRGGQQFHAFSSTNLNDWQRHGPVLDFADVRWIKDDGAPEHRAWAPAIVHQGGRFFFYYSVGPQNPTPSRIGVAVGDSPAGPFRDSGRPLLTGGNGFEAIDPMVFTDAASGKSYFYAGGSAGATLRVFELNDDLVSFAREVPVATPPRFTEAPFMHERDGRYYLSYSHGNFRDGSYSVHYATAPSPIGPWEYRGAILTSDATRKGPGHHSFFREPASGDWFIAYHRWENQPATGPFRGSRQIAIDRLEHDAEGLIRPVVMTDGAPSPPVLESGGQRSPTADER